MAKGSPLVALRIPKEFLDAMDARIAEVNDRRKDEPYNRSTFILDAIEEKLNKLERGRRKAELWDWRECRPAALPRKG